MKTIGKPIEMIAHYKDKGEPVPIRFRYSTEEAPVVVQVDKILETRREKNPDFGMTVIYRCQSLRDGVTITYELRFLVDRMGWQLWRG